MSYSFVNRPAVRTDIITATEYYKKIDIELAKQFLFRVREAKEYIARTPTGFQQKYKHIRTFLLRQFPYHIHYIIDDDNQVIVILAIIHAYKNPKDYSIR